MKNAIQNGCVMNYAASDDIKGGDVVKMAACIGVAVADIASGSTGAVAVCGVFELPKESGVIEQGAAVYLKGNGKIVTAASGNTFAGVAFEKAASNASSVVVAINFGTAPAAA